MSDDPLRKVVMVVRPRKDLGSFLGLSGFRQLYKIGYPVDYIDDLLIDHVKFKLVLFQENGVVALITDDGTMEVFSKKWDSTTIKTIKDPDIDPEMMLCRNKNKLQFFKSNKLYSIKMK